MKYLNVGSGDHPLEGFINIDERPMADLRHDVARGLPFPDASVDGVYSEHFLEHLSQAQGLSFLRECRRVAKPDGIVRVAMPDLDELIERYGNSDWRGDGDMFKLGFHWVDNRCEMMNIAMREWGHQWLYNEQELRLAAARAGLAVRGRVKWGESEIPQFRGLEYRPGSKLVMELEKPHWRPTADPLVSVLILVQDVSFLEPALQSVLAQTYRNLEVIVVAGDVGTDLDAVVARIARNDRRVRCERSHERLGHHESCSMAFSRSRGEYIKFLGDGDVLLPSCVDRMVAAFAASPHATLVTSKRRRIDQTGGSLPDADETRGLADSDRVIEGVSLAATLLECGNYVGGLSNIMFRKADAAWVQPNILSFGGESFTECGDVALWMNLLGRGDAVYLTDVLSCSRERRGDAATMAREWRQIRIHARRLGFLERSEAPVIKVKAPGAESWNAEWFRWGPPRSAVLKRRAVEIVRERMLRPLSEAKRRVALEASALLAR